MSKDDKIAEGRSQGLLTAYRIAKQAAEEGKDPVATLEAELKYRRITKINIPVTKKELETAGERYRINAVQSCRRWQWSRSGAPSASEAGSGSRSSRMSSSGMRMHFSRDILRGRMYLIRWIRSAGSRWNCQKTCR